MMDCYIDITEIQPGLYLGDETDAKTFDGAVVSVHESPDVYRGDHWIPIMLGARRGIEDFDESQFRASRDMLNAATSIMRHYERQGTPVLVHCAQGIERSPLTMTWFLRRYHEFKTLPDAMEYVRCKRPIAQDRLSWLNPVKEAT